MYIEVAFIGQKPILLTLDAHKFGIRKIIIMSIVLSFSLSLGLSPLHQHPLSRVCTRNRADVYKITDLSKLT